MQMALQLNPTIYDFDRQLQKASAALAEITDDVAEEIAGTETEEGVQYDQALFEKLKTWRLSQAAKEGMPAYVIAHNSTLEQMAARLPVTASQLTAIKGFGPNKSPKYGDEILKIILDHLPQEARTEQPTTSETAEITDEISDREQKTAATKAEYPRSGKRWTPEENAQLLAAFKNREPLGKICSTLKRSPGSLWVKLAQLLDEETS